MRPLRIGVIGSGDANAEAQELAHRVGAAIARAEAVGVCGGLGGVMAAAAAGATEDGGLVIGILPGTSAEAAAPGVTVPIPTGLGEARNVLVVRASEAIIAIAGELGTTTEAAFAQKFGIPVIGLATRLPDELLTERADDPAAAVARAVELAEERRRETRG